MQDIKPIYQRIEKNKKDIREINKAIKDELVNIARHKEILEELKKLRDEKKSIEKEIAAGSQGEMDRMEGLKLEVAADKELLSDLALNMYVEKQNVEIIDDYDNRYVPYFSVTFRKE